MFGWVQALLLLLLLQGGAVWAQPELKIYAMDSRPVSFRNGDQADGLVVEVARQVQQRIGTHERIDIIPWARANTLAATEPNVLLLSIVRTPERAQYLRFVGPLFYSHISAFAMRSRAAELRARDPGLRTLRAGARRGSIFLSRARREGYNVLDETSATGNAFRMLVMGRFDLWFEGEEIAFSAIQAAGLKPDDLEVMVRLSTEQVYFAFSRDTPDAVVQAWDGALAGMKRDGSYQRILRKWMPGAELPPVARQSPLKEQRATR